MPALSVSVIGAGSFGTVIARILARSCAASAASTASTAPAAPAAAAAVTFANKVRLWARRQALADEINAKHTNEQYLGADCAIPDNVVATADLQEALEGADVVVLAVPHEFAVPMLESAKAWIGDGALVVSLLKGLHYEAGRGVVPLAQCIEEALGAPKRSVSVLMGPNIYTEMARDQFAEATLGMTAPMAAMAPTALQQQQQQASSPPAVLHALFNGDPATFAARVSFDRTGVELCGALKNVAALAAGFCEGLGMGMNVKASVIRCGLAEIAAFNARFFPGESRPGTTLEAAGVGDLVLTLTQGRGRRLAASFVQDRLAGGSKGWEALEDELFSGMKLPDWRNAQALHAFLQSQPGTVGGLAGAAGGGGKATGLVAEEEKAGGGAAGGGGGGGGAAAAAAAAAGCSSSSALRDFPLFAATHAVAFEGKPATIILDCLRASSAQDTTVGAGGGGGGGGGDEKDEEESRLPGLRGRRALVTGGAQGIGRAIAERLLRCGVRVVVLDRSADTLAAMGKEIAARGFTVGGPGGQLTSLCADLTDGPGTVAKVEACIDEAGGGPFDFLVNNAGIAKFADFYAPRSCFEEFDLTYSINVQAPYYLTQLVARKLVEAGSRGGSIVHITSQSSTLALKDHLVYSSSKAALEHASRIQALELGASGIRVNTVKPTVVLTALAKAAWDPAALETMKAQIPLQRLAEPDDVAKTVCWLLSSDADMITGSAIAVDGGRTMGGCGL